MKLCRRVVKTIAAEDCHTGNALVDSTCPKVIVISGDGSYRKGLENKEILLGTHGYSSCALGLAFGEVFTQKNENGGGLFKAAKQQTELPSSVKLSLGQLRMNVTCRCFKKWTCQSYQLILFSMPLELCAMFMNGAGLQRGSLSLPCNPNKT